MGELGEVGASKPTPHVLVVGSCIVDLLFFVDRMPMAGESLLARARERRLGGKGFNQAVALTRLGCNVTLVSGVGQDEFALPFYERAEREGVTFRPDAVASATTGVAALMITPDGVSSIVVDAGASMCLSAAHVEDVLRDGRWDAVLVHYEVPTDCLRVVFDCCEALDLCIVCNPAPWIGQGALEFAQRADAVVLNRVEAEQLAREAGADFLTGSAAELARSCADVCEGQLLVLTLGGDGFVAVYGGETTQWEAVPVKAVDSTGAGDAFCAALVYGLVQGWNEPRTLALAAGTAALACTMPGGSDSMPEFDKAVELASTHRLWIENQSQCITPGRQ